MANARNFLSKEFGSTIKENPNSITINYYHEHSFFDCGMGPVEKAINTRQSRGIMSQIKDAR